MRRFLAFWIVLTPACWLAVEGVSLGIFRHADFSYRNFAVLVTAPVLQALVLAAATSAVSRSALFAHIRAALGDPLAQPVLLLDVLLLGSGWLWRAHPLLGLSTGASLHAAWIGTKALVAGAFLLYAVVRQSRTTDLIPERTRFGSFDCAWLTAGAIALGLAGAQAFVPWIEQGVAAVFPQEIRAWPTLFRWLAAYGTLFVAVNALLLRTGTALGRGTASDFWMQTGVAFNFCVGLIAAHGFFGLPYLVEPWHSLAWTAGSLAATSVLLGAILAPGRRRAGSLPRR